MDTPAAPAASPLSPFDGRQVVRSSIAVTNAGDGLSDALGIDPQEFHHGDVVHVVLECEVTKVAYVPVSKETPDVLVRQHTLKAGTGTIVDSDLVDEHVKAQREKIDTARRHARGEHTLDEAELDRQHEQGDHDANPVAGCERCTEALALRAAEEAAAAGGGKVQQIGDRRSRRGKAD